MMAEGAGTALLLAAVVGSGSLLSPTPRRADSRGPTWAPADVPGFLVGQAVGAALATLLFRWLTPAPPAVSDRLVAPHEQVSA